MVSAEDQGSERLQDIEEKLNQAYQETCLDSSGRVRYFSEEGEVRVGDLQYPVPRSLREEIEEILEEAEGKDISLHLEGEDLEKNERVYSVHHH